MKLRIRFQARRELIEVGNSQCTTTDLMEIVRAQFLLTNANFRLSLDAKTPLSTEESLTLADLGIVGGDLLYVILDDDSNTPAISQVNDDSNTPAISQVNDDSNTPAISQHSVERALQQIKNPTLNEALDVISQEELSTSTHTASTSSNTEYIQTKKSMDTISHSSNEKSMKLNSSCKETDPTAVLPSQRNEESLKLRKIEYTPKALLCRDGIPYSLQMSYELSHVATMHEAVCVTVHVLMLETGFLNHGLEDSKPIISEEASTSSKNDPGPSTCSTISHNWRTDSGARFLYTHPACPGLVSSVICTSLGPYVLVHGMSTSPSCTEVHQCRLPAADFVKGNIDLKSSNAADVYKHLQRLSLVVKDQIAYPLLSSMRHELNLEEMYGFMALPTEVKLMVLCILPVKDILNMSATCREVHTITCDHILWQHLYFRDFALLTKGRYSTWKMEYQRHYKELVERERNRQFFPPETIIPDHPVGLFGGYDPPNHFPPGIIGGRHDLFPNVPFMPGGVHPNPGSTPGNLPHPRFDPYGPEPDMDIDPGPNRRTPGRGRGRGGFPPGPFF